MQIILSAPEFQAAIHCWLTSQGLDSTRYDINVKVIQGRSDTGGGSRAEVNLEPKIISLPESVPPFDVDIIEEEAIETPAYMEESVPDEEAKPLFSSRPSFLSGN